MPDGGKQTQSLENKGLSSIQSRSSSENWGSEEMADVNALEENVENFQYNFLGGPLGEEFQELNEAD